MSKSNSERSDYFSIGSLSEDEDKKESISITTPKKKEEIRNNIKKEESSLNDLKSNYLVRRASVKPARVQYHSPEASNDEVHRRENKLLREIKKENPIPMLKLEKKSPDTHSNKNEQLNEINNDNSIPTLLNLKVHKVESEQKNNSSPNAILQKGGSEKKTKERRSSHLVRRRFQDVLQNKKKEPIIKYQQKNENNIKKQIPNISKERSDKKNEEEEEFINSDSDSLDDTIENELGELIDKENNESSFLKEMLIETNKHYIKKQKNQNEKVKKCAISIIINILVQKQKLLFQYSFLLIKYKRENFTKNRAIFLVKCFDKISKQSKSFIIRNTFSKWKLKIIQEKSKTDRIIQLINELEIDNNNINDGNKIKEILLQKIEKFSSIKPQTLKEDKDKESLIKIENNNLNLPSTSIEKEKENAKDQKIDNTQNSPISIPLPINSNNDNKNPQISIIKIIPTVPQPPPLISQGVPQCPPMLSNGNSAIPPIPNFLNFLQPNTIDPTKDLPHPSKAKNTKKYQWNVIKQKEYASSFWEKYQKKQNESKLHLDIDYEKLEHLFSEEKKNEQKKQSTNLQKIENTIKILDDKRQMNISISLLKIKITIDFLKSSIENLDIENKLSLDEIETILSIFPTEEEIKNLKKYNGDESKLSFPEQFCRTLISYDYSKNFFTVLKYRNKLNIEVNDIINKIVILNDCLNSINNSEQFKQILFIIRQIGNFLNHGTAKGKALGFSVFSLEKMDEIKSYTKEKSSLLEFLILNIKKKEPFLLNFHKEIIKIKEAGQIDKSELESRIKALESQIDEIKRQMEKKQNEKFLNFLLNTEQYIRKKLECIKLNNNILQKEVDICILMFGEDAKKFNYSDFIQVINKFILKYKEITFKVSQKEAKILKKKLNEEKKKNKAIPITLLPNNNNLTILNSINTNKTKNNFNFNFNSRSNNINNPHMESIAADFNVIRQTVTRKTIARKTAMKKDGNEIREMIKKERANLRDQFNCLTAENNRNGIIDSKINSIIEEENDEVADKKNIEEEYYLINKPVIIGFDKKIKQNPFSLGKENKTVQNKLNKFI